MKKTEPRQAHPGVRTGIPLKLSAIAESLAPTFHLYLAGRNRESLEHLANHLPSAEVFIGDLTTEAGIAAVTSGVRNLDALIHSAWIC